MNKRTIFNKVIESENDKWSVVQDDWCGVWVAAAPNLKLGDVCFDRSFYTHKEALAYAIERADIDATQERLV